jgi:predicted transcriptional regulator
MSKPKRERSITATVHLDAHTWKRVSALAVAERRPTSQLLRNLIADAIGATGRAKPAAAGDQEAA